MIPFARRLRLTLKNFRRLLKVAQLYVPFKMKPEQIQVDITDQCNYRCPTCSKWLHTSSDNELTTEQWKTFFSQSAMLPFSRRVVFAGGEPLLRSDILELVSHVSSLKLTPVVITNGSLLTRTKLEELQEAGVDYLMISLNALNPVLHDDTRGVTGSFSNLMQVIERYSAMRKTMKMGIATVIMKRNIEHILPLVDFVTKHHLHGILFQAYMDDAVHHPFRGEHHSFRDADWFDGNPDVIHNFDRLNVTIDRLLQRQGTQILNAPSQLRAMKAFYRNPITYQAIRCTAGITSFLVDAYGDVRVCFGFAPVGNILQQEPPAIWKSFEATEVRKQVAQCNHSCRIMNHVY